MCLLAVFPTNETCLLGVICAANTNISDLSRFGVYGEAKSMPDLGVSLPVLDEHRAHPDAQKSRTVCTSSRRSEMAVDGDDHYSLMPGSIPQRAGDEAIGALRP